MISGLGNSSLINQSTSFALNSSKDFDHKDFNQTKPNFRATTRNYSMNVPKPYNNMMPKKVIYKDPDVWDPPELQLKKNQSKPKIVQQPQSRAGKNFNVNKTIQKPSSKAIKKEDGKPSFLFDRYPDGQGPDSNLIEML
jgi:hypothetical protein